MYSGTIEKKEELKVVGLVLQTSFAANRQAEDIPPFFHKNMETKILKSVPNRVNNNQICIINRKENSPDFDYYMGVEVGNYSDVPDGMASITLQASDYAVTPFIKKGNADVMMAVKYLTEEWIPQNAHKEAQDKPGIIYYDEDFIKGFEEKGYEGDLTAKLLIPVT